MKATFVLVVAAAFAAGFTGRRLGAAETSTDDVETLRRRVAVVESARAAAVVAPTPADRRIDDLESRVAAAMSNATSAATKVGTDEPDGDSELEQLRGLGDPAVLEFTRELAGTQWQRSQEEQTAAAARIVAACDLLLARKLPASRRADVLTQKGVAVRCSGDFVRAESLMRESLALVEPTSNEGVEAAMQLAFNRSLQYDCRGAAERFLAIATQSAMPADVRAQCRRRAAGFFAAAKDVAAAREHYRAVIDEFGASDDRSARYWADESRTALEKLDRDADAR